jgi:hypothetical protein
LLRECKFAARGEAGVYVEMADTYCYEADWKAARHYYDLARKNNRENELYKILSAKCNTHFGELESARLKLQEVDATKLDIPGFADYAFQYAQLALTSKDAHDVECAKSFLSKVESRWPYFREQRDKFIITLLSGEGIKQVSIAEPKNGMLLKMLRYVNISPGLFGVSLDLNKVIEDWAANKKDGTIP